ncbi:MAG: protein kinase [Candidatus Sumerlaeia bacterium]|nr:protein kinase [Candidatus Sumerlaeia bacterium]
MAQKVLVGNHIPGDIPTVQQVCVTLIERERRPVSFMLDAEEIPIGRSSRCTVTIDKDQHPEISRNHGRIFREDDKWFYEDLGSTHGSYYRGRQIQGKAPLDWGDRILLGRNGVVLTITWPIPRVTGIAGTHLRLPATNNNHFPLAFSDPFLNRYKIYRQIGAGGFGDVWQAIASDGSLPVAVKILRPTLLALDTMDPIERVELINRFSREIEVTKVLANSGAGAIVRVYDSGEDVNRDFIYIVMDYIEGESMDRVIRRNKTLSQREVALYLHPIAQTLQAAHAISWSDESGQTKHGIVHRDIKPSNIMIEKETNQSFLVDFGIAAINRGGDRLTALDMTIGSVGYMPPEALFSSRADPAVDLWAFSVTLYVSLSGHLPYQGKTIAEQYENIKNHNFTPITNWRTDLDPLLAESLERALNPDPAKRILHAEEWLEILRRLL